MLDNYRNAPVLLSNGNAYLVSVKVCLCVGDKDGKVHREADKRKKTRESVEMVDAL